MQREQEKEQRDTAALVRRVTLVNARLECCLALLFTQFLGLLEGLTYVFVKTEQSLTGAGYVCAGNLLMFAFPSRSIFPIPAVDSVDPACSHD